MPGCFGFQISTRFDSIAFRPQNAGGFCRCKIQRGAGGTGCNAVREGDNATCNEGNVTRKGDNGACNEGNVAREGDNATCDGDTPLVTGATPVTRATPPVAGITLLMTRATPFVTRQIETALMP